MASEMIKLKLKEGDEFEFTMTHLEKAVMLKQMLCDLGYEEGAVPSESVPLPSVGSEALRTIVAWLGLHEEVEPRSEEDRQIHRFNRNLAREDVELLGRLEPEEKLFDVINAAYCLEMPDLIDTLVKYSANVIERILDSRV